jgi:thiol-disulfide isomerase/thioredoxin
MQGGYMKYIVLLLVFSSTVFAGITENQIEFKVEKQQIQITPKPGFHLNKDAPASAVIDDLEALNKPVTKTEKLFTFKKGEKSKKAVLSFYVCDDKQTVCEKHDKTLDLNSGNVKSTSVKSSFNNIKELNLKSTNGKPTLLVFSAPWCPACIRMVTETYHQPGVEKQLAKLNFVKLNSDLPENNELSEKFHVKAIPTLILLDKDGNESYRWLDFQRPKNFAKELDVELQKVAVAATVAESAKLGDPSAASVLAHRAYNALNYEEAYKWFTLTTSERDQKYKLASEVSLAASKADEDPRLVREQLTALEKGIVLTPSKLDQVRWTIDYFDKKSELKEFGPEAKAKAASLVKDLDFLIKNPRNATTAFAESTYGDYTGFEAAELLWMKAKVAALIGDAKLEADTKKASVALLTKKNLSVDRPGEMLLGIAYLREAGEKVAVEKLYKQLTAKYPTTYVYFEKYARFAQKNKNLDQALSLVTEALKFPEGNTPQLGLLKTQILIDLKKKDEALATIDQTLQTSGVEHKRYAKTVKKLNDLKNELKENVN